MTALTATDLVRLYTTKAGVEVGVRGVSLSIVQGETVAILGPNGSGKSTLLGMLATIDPPDSGSLEISGNAVSRNSTNAQRRAARTHLGVVFQSHILDPLLTVHENLCAAAALYQLASPTARIDELLETLRLSDRVADRVGNLSGGLARRADLARALLHAPRVLLLDEPTTGLDPDARADLIQTLAGLKDSANTPAVLLTTHLTQEAETADRVLIMDAGDIAAQGTPAELRAGLGEQSLIVEHAPDEQTDTRSRLESLGLAITNSSSTQTAASITESDPARVASALLSVNARFSIGPPTLADVYTATIGYSDADAPAGAAS